MGANKQALDTIPYFERLFTRLRENDPITSTAFGRHVHWGYWSDPAKAADSAADYARAAEEMCRRHCDAAAIGDGQRVLDVGCGFGGTIASLNERFNSLYLAGVNIDARQLERARATVGPANGNLIDFVEANAIDLPFAAESFDAVLAVECIFHFPDRRRFFAEAARVLRPGGMLVVSDFVPTEEALPLLQAYDPGEDAAVQATYGKLNVHFCSSAYHDLGQDVGMTMTREEDISVHTMPTYRFLRGYMQREDDPSSILHVKATSQLEKTCRKGWLRYTILSFRKRTAAMVLAA